MTAAGTARHPECNIPQSAGPDQGVAQLIPIVWESRKKADNAGSIEGRRRGLAGRAGCAHPSLDGIEGDALWLDAGIRSEREDAANIEVL